MSKNGYQEWKCEAYAKYEFTFLEKNSFQYP